jgi:hypothetical protein
MKGKNDSLLDRGDALNLMKERTKEEQELLSRDQHG